MRVITLKSLLMLCIIFYILDTTAVPTITPPYIPVVYYFTMDLVSGKSLIGTSISGALSQDPQFLPGKLNNVN